ncbi:MAG TPA: hypothetical protein VI895_00160 [Bdellovibrionota bacterium]|nr:hypothetical protein [Bdellovibrionota bacterium]
MKRALTFFLAILNACVLGPLQSHADEDTAVPNGTIVHYSEVRSDASDLKPLHSFIEALIQRKLAQDTAVLLELKGFRTDQIEEILRSTEFKNFAQRVIEDSATQHSVDFVVLRWTDAEQMKIRRSSLETDRRDTAAMEDQLQLQQALRQKRLNREVPPRKPELDGWSRLIEQSKDYLFR